MKTIIFKSDYVDKYRSYVMILLKINDIKCKITYDCHNGNESCDTEIFNGFKFNHILSMMDIGIKPDTSLYVCDEDKKTKRSKFVIDKSIEVLTKFLK